MDTKLEIVVELYGKSAVIFRLKRLSSVISKRGVFESLYKNKVGYSVISAKKFRYTPEYILFPTEEEILENGLKIEDMFSCYSFSSDAERKEELKRLFDFLGEFSRSDVFQNDKRGHVGMTNDKWIVF